VSAPRFWDEEIQRAADARGISRDELADLMSLSRPGARDSDDDPELREEAIIQALRPLLVACAEALEDWAEASPGRTDVEETARAGLSTIALAADLLEIGALTEWATRLSKADDLRARAGDAGRMLRGEAFEIVWSKSLAELRACRWEWPQPRVEAPRKPEVTVAPAAEVTSPPEIPARVEPPAEAPTLFELAPPTPHPPVVEKPLAEPVRRGPLRALVADPSVIAGGFLARLLSARGVSVTTVEDAVAAQRELDTRDFDLVFVDMDWPDPQTRESLVAGLAAGRVVFVGADPRDANRASEPRTKFLLKPPSAEELDILLAATPRRMTAPRSPR